MAGAQHIDVLRSLGLVSRSSRRHVSLPLSWNTFMKHRNGKDFAMLLTIIGAGSMGAFIAMRYASGIPVALKFSWTAADKDTTSIVVKNKALLDVTVAGLQNVGNNCFLNVVLQALASSEILVSFMEECASVIDTQYVQAERATMPLAAAIADLLKELSHCQMARRVLSPRRVMLALNLYTRHFDLSMQQDAAEALAHLAAGLQEEREKYLYLRRPVSQSFGTVLDSVAATPRLDHSWLHWPLEGTIGSLMACQRCGFQFSTVFQYFNDISLPLARPGDGQMIDNCSLEDCLDRFTASEWVASVKCSHCSHMNASQVLHTKLDNIKLTSSLELLDVHTIQESIESIQKCSCDDDCSCEALFLKHGGVWNSVHTNASKRLRIGRSPEVLCLQVQRAVINELGELRKLTGHVKFPTILDLFPYTVAAQDIKIRSIDTRTEDVGSPLIRMLGQRRVMLSHIRKFQGSDYPASLFSLETGIKGGSELSKLSDDLGRPLESPHKPAAVEDVVSEEGLVPEDSQTDLGAVTSVASNEISEAGDLTVVETSNLGVLNSSTPGCTDLGALADPHGVQSVKPSAEGALTSRKLLYELLSIVVHHGGPQSGHYTVYRKVRLPKDMDLEVRTTDEGGTAEVPRDFQFREGTERGNAGGRESALWFKVSDTNVRRVEETEVQLANASLLFYERLRIDS